MSERDEQGRPEAFEAFYARTAPSLWGYISRVCGDAALADDIIQETFIRYLDHVREDLPERQRKAFAYKIASRLLTDEFRRAKALSLDAVGEGLVGERPAGDPALSPDLARLFGSLPSRDRALLWLAYAEGYSHAEIAEILGLSAGSIKVLLFRLRRSFASALKDIGYHPEVFP